MKAEHTLGTVFPRFLQALRSNAPAENCMPVLLEMSQHIEAAAGGTINTDCVAVTMHNMLSNHDFSDAHQQLTLLHQIETLQADVNLRSLHNTLQHESLQIAQGVLGNLYPALFSQFVIHLTDLDPASTKTGVSDNLMSPNSIFFGVQLLLQDYMSYKGNFFETDGRAIKVYDHLFYYCLHHEALAFMSESVLAMLTDIDTSHMIEQYNKFVHYQQFGALKHLLAHLPDTHDLDVHVNRMLETKNYKTLAFVLAEFPSEKQLNENTLKRLNNNDKDRARFLGQSEPKKKIRTTITKYGHAVCRNHEKKVGSPRYYGALFYFQAARPDNVGPLSQLNHRHKESKLMTEKLQPEHTHTLDTLHKHMAEDYPELFDDGYRDKTLACDSEAAFEARYFVRNTQP